MKRAITVGLCLALCLALLAACGRKPAASESKVAAAVSAPASSTPASLSVTTDNFPMVGDLQAIGSVKLDYNAIWPVSMSGWQIEPVRLERDGTLRYYTMEKNGLWGLMDASGKEILPCKATLPVRYCGNDLNWGHWIWDAQVTEAEFATLSAQLLAQAQGEIEPGHGAMTYLYYYEAATGAQRYALDIGLGAGEAVPADVYAAQNGWLPVEFADVAAAEAKAAETGDPVDGAGQDVFNYADASGKLLVPEATFGAVGWFGKAKLAPVKLADKWAYVDTTGAYATELVYDNAWGTKRDTTSYNETTGTYAYTMPTQAYSFQGGFAPVTKDGKWGVIDETGREVVPCEYEGAAPADGGVWIKVDGVWEKYAR